jgi:hypothetical protein
MDLAHVSALRNNQLVPLATLTSIISCTSTLISLVFYFHCLHIQMFSFSLPMPWESTLSVILYHYYYYYCGYPNFLCLVNHIIVILPFRCFGSFSCRFCLSSWLLTFYLGHSVCYLGLLYSFSDNFVVSRYLIKDIVLLLSYIIIIKSSYSTTCHL